MNYFNKCILLIILYLPILAHSQVIRPFEERASFNTNGNIALIGNTLMTCTISTSCSETQAGIQNRNNNDFDMVFVNTDPAAGFSNSSQAELSLPQGAHILFAGLYWGGRADETDSNRSYIQIKPPGQPAYIPVVANVIDIIPDRNTPQTRPYQASADITNLVQAGGNGNYSVGDLTSLTGELHGGTFGGWSMAVIYQDNSQPFRRLMLFDGAADVGNNDNVMVRVNGLLTPSNGSFNTYIGALSWEGDAGISGDSLKFEGATINQNINSSQNFWNGSISHLDSHVTQKTPNYINQLTMDVDMVDVSNLLANGSTDADISFTSTGDGYFPHYLSFVTELYLPDFSATLSKTALDINGGNINTGDIIEYTISFKNSGQESAINTELTDVLPDFLTYVPDSMQIIQSDVGPTGNQTDAIGDDLADYNVASKTLTFRLGQDANSQNGGVFNYDQGATVKFRAIIDQNAPYGDIINTATITANSLILPNEDYTSQNTAIITLGDNQAPLPPVIFSPTEGALITTNQPIVSGTAEPGATIQVTGTNGQTCETVANAGGGWSCEISPVLWEGNNAIEVTATDTAGNISDPSTVNFTVDTVPPEAAVCTVSPNPANNGTHITAVCNGVETGGAVSIPGYVCAAESNGEVICTATVGVNGVDGDEKAITYDGAGNTNQSDVSFTLDNTPPVPPNITSPESGFVSNIQPIISGTGEIGTWVTVKGPHGEACNSLVDNNGQWSCGLTPMLQDGDNVITASASDEAGNQSDTDSIILSILSFQAHQLNVETNGTLITTEAGGTATFTVSLPLTPTADVSVNLSSDDITEGTVSPSNIIFSPNNWNNPVTITITGVDDSEYDLDQNYNLIIGPLNSLDDDYNGINTDDLVVTNKDDDERADLSAFISNCINGIQPESLITYHVIIHNTGNKDIQNATVTTIFNGEVNANDWLCDATDEASCHHSVGFGELNEVINLKVDEAIMFDINSHVTGEELSFADVQTTVTLAASETDVNLDNNTAYDSDLIYPFLYKEGFECAVPGTLASTQAQLKQL